MRRRWWLLLVLLLALLLGPIAWVETVCRPGPWPTSPPSRLAGGPYAAALRPAAASYLSYPEWHIVYAYEDLAAQLRAGDESGFAYLPAIFGFWRSYCGVNRLAGAAMPTNVRVMLWTIGPSFEVELALKGLYETTLGRLAETVRGPMKTAEDRFAAEVAEDYAAFLRQTPWYQYPFGAKVQALWRLPPEAGGSWLRRHERRLALGLEWSLKAGYAALLRLAAGQALAQVDRTTLAVLAPPAGDPTPPPGFDLVETFPDGALLVRAPRYRFLAERLAEAARAGFTPLEVAGNRKALVTALLPRGRTLRAPAAVELFRVAAHGERERLGLDVELAGLAGLLAAIDAAGGRFEHLYDY